MSDGVIPCILLLAYLAALDIGNDVTCGESIGSIILVAA